MVVEVVVATFELLFVAATDARDAAAALVLNGFDPVVGLDSLLILLPLG